MLYTDDELRRWWEKLSKIEQRDTLEVMVEKMTGSQMAKNFLDQYERGHPFSPKQLGAIRKWARG